MQIYPSTYKKSIARDNYFISQHIKSQLVEMDWAKTGEKLKLIRKAKGLKQTEFARLLEIKQPNLSDYETGKVEPEVRTIKDILSIAQVSKRWWDNGEGDIFISQDISINDKDKAIPLAFVDETDVEISTSGMEFRDLDNGMVLMTIPLVDEYAYASYPHGWRDKEYLVELPKYSIVLPKRERGIFRAFEVRGDSMDDGTRYAICYGDVAIGRMIEPEYWDIKLHTNGGTDYVIVTHDGVVVKRITKHDTKDGIITCSSLNPDKTEYPDYDIRLTEVYELYKVRKVDRDWSRR